MNGKVHLTNMDSMRIELMKGTRHFTISFGQLSIYLSIINLHLLLVFRRLQLLSSVYFFYVYGIEIDVGPTRRVDQWPTTFGGYSEFFPHVHATTQSSALRTDRVHICRVQRRRSEPPSKRYPDYPAEDFLCVALNIEVTHLAFPKRLQLSRPP